jgi:hypothetical protein
VGAAGFLASFSSLIAVAEDEFPAKFKPQRVGLARAKALTNLRPEEIAGYFRDHSFEAKQLLDESSNKRFTPSTFIQEKDGGFHVGCRLSLVLARERPLEAPGKGRLNSQAARERRLLECGATAWYFQLLARSGGTGRRAGLKIRWPQGRVGSTPSVYTDRFQNKRKLGEYAIYAAFYKAVGAKVCKLMQQKSTFAGLLYTP